MTPRTSVHQVAEPRWSPSEHELDDLECLLLGAYPALRGFLGPDDLASVAENARLADGTPWPVPVTLRVSSTVAASARAAGSLVLLDAEGTPVGRVAVEQLWDVDGAVGVAGPVAPLARLERGTHRALRLPATAAATDRPGPVLGIPVDGPPHAPQLAQWRQCARDLGGRIRLLPLTGSGRAGVLDGPALVRICVDAAAGLGADVVPLAVPHHGDAERDRLAVAVVAGAYGATHLPGPTPVIDPDWTAAVPRFVALPEVVRDRRTGLWELQEPVPPEFRCPDRAEDASASVQQMIARGEAVPAWLTGQAVVQELARAHRGPDTGFTVLLTGLSGSGKSTIAKALQAALLQRTGRTVTLLDGDVVRSMLSSELTFTREHRELNVRRIGFVASEVTRHGGIAICAPIAPYATSRAEVRAMIAPLGGFLLVHVSTSLEVCESRDRKGLYAKARAGLLPGFTGVSDPYELPADADLTIDTAVESAQHAVNRVLDDAVCRGWLDLPA